MGEGISCAFEHGKLAANAICKFLDGDSGALRAYDRALHEGAVGKKLSKLAFAARHFYGPHHRLFFRLARSAAARRRSAWIGTTARGISTKYLLGAWSLDGLARFY